MIMLTIIAFEMCSVQTKPHSRRIPSVRRAFSKKFRFRDGLMWTLSLTVDIKLRIHISLFSKLDTAAKDEYFFSFLSN